MIARNADNLNNTVKAIKAAGGEAAAFPVKEYSYPAVIAVFNTINAHKWSTSEPAEVRVALWNAGSAPFKNFLNITEEDLKEALDGNVVAPFAFSRQAILTFQKNSIDNLGKRGTLLFTGATASIRGNVTTSAFAAGKFGLRALSQSLAKEFGKENIHVRYHHYINLVDDANVLSSVQVAHVSHVLSSVILIGLTDSSFADHHRRWHPYRPLRFPQNRRGSGGIQEKPGHSSQP